MAFSNLSGGSLQHICTEWFVVYTLRTLSGLYTLRIYTEWFVVSCHDTAAHLSYDVS